MKSVRRFGALVLAALGAAGCDGGESAVADARMRVSDVLGGADTAGYARALEPRPFTFPRDHGPHPAFRTEWWYLTGNLAGEEGRRFGYQLTIFRVALAPPSGGSGASRRGDGPAVDGAGSGGGGSVGPRSAWATRQAYMGHFAVTDADGERFLAEERFARGALGLAGAGLDPLRVWIEDWTIEGRAGDGFAARARGDGFAVELELERGKAPVLNGERGLSPKGPEPGNASYYYSLTRMPTRGTVTVDGRTIVVRGLSWLDREWSTSALGPELEGWDWLALQLEGDRELMVYRLRRPDGSAAPLSGGTWVAPDGSSRALGVDDVLMEPVDWWRSPGGDAEYPVAWRLRVPALELTLDVRPLLDGQEWTGAFRYWEGAVAAAGAGPGGEAVRGRGYLELTGYAGSAPPGGTAGIVRGEGR
ncbi:MAG TPA: lipocalin-like domain-containing protein [Longimicrobiales bacterium]|nr:lipocalin-like domain-containing protein [Longimicrobiales bacterium]